MKTVLAAGLALATALAAAPASASSMPRVDFGTQPILGLGFGIDRGLSTGGSAALDVPLSDRLMVGGAIGTTFGGAFNFDVRGVYNLVEGSRETPAIGGIIGLWGAPGLAGFDLPGAVAPVIGFGLAYGINEQFDVRLNLTYSPLFDYGQSEFLTFIGGPPLAGFEVTYQLTPGIEATLGINGRGDVVGVNMVF